MNNRQLFEELVNVKNIIRKTGMFSIFAKMATSLSKINYCMKKLNDKGCAKLISYSRNTNKVGYIYLSIFKWIKQKAIFTTSFLKTKIKEFETLKEEISMLKLDTEIWFLNKR